MPHLNANGIRLHYELTGPTGAPVVMLSHSLATDLHMWDPQMGPLASSYRVLRYDTRGHGRTEATPGPYSFTQLANDASALWAALEIERVHFVGLSMGGMIGQTLALEHPESLASLVLSDTSGRTPPEARAMWDERIALARSAGMQAHVDPTLGRWFTPGFITAHTETLEPVRAMIRTTSVEGYEGCGRAIAEFDLLDRLTEIDLPTLVIVGADDPGTPVQAARALHERIAGSELVVIESASHLANFEQPDAFNAALLGFLARAAG